MVAGQAKPFQEECFGPGLRYGYRNRNRNRNRNRFLYYKSYGILVFWVLVGISLYAMVLVSL